MRYGWWRFVDYKWLLVFFLLLCWRISWYYALLLFQFLKLFHWWFGYNRFCCRSITLFNNTLITVLIDHLNPSSHWLLLLLTIWLGFNSHSILLRCHSLRSTRLYNWLALFWFVNYWRFLDNRFYWTRWLDNLLLLLNLRSWLSLKSLNLVSNNFLWVKLIIVWFIWGLLFHLVGWWGHFISVLCHLLLSPGLRFLFGSRFIIHENFRLIINLLHLLLSRRILLLINLLIFS